MFTRTFWILFYQIIPALRKLGQKTIKFLAYTVWLCLRKKKKSNRNYQNRGNKVESERKFWFHKTTVPGSTASEHFPASVCQPILQRITQLCSLLTRQKPRGQVRPSKQPVKPQLSTLLIHYVWMKVCSMTFWSSYYLYTNKQKRKRKRGGSKGQRPWLAYARKSLIL